MALSEEYKNGRDMGRYYHDHAQTPVTYEHALDQAADNDYDDYNRGFVNGWRLAEKANPRPELSVRPDES